MLCQILPQFGCGGGNFSDQFNSATHDIDDVLQIVAAQHITLPTIPERLKFGGDKLGGIDHAHHHAGRQRYCARSVHHQRLPAIGKPE